MLNRRQTLRGLAAAATGFAASAVSAKDRCVAFTPDMQQAKTPAQALERLQERNARFVAGQALHCDLLDQVRSTAQQQAPFAVVLGCIPSRVPPELIFDQNIGDMFVARQARLQVGRHRRTRRSCSVWPNRMRRMPPRI